MDGAGVGERRDVAVRSFVIEEVWDSLGTVSGVPFQERAKSVIVKFTMSKQQSKRRRKRYNPGSAYAGDVKPTGVLGFIGNAKTIRFVFIAMALALAAGGGAALFGGNLGGSGGHGDSSSDFVIQEDEQTSAPDQQPETEEERFTTLPVMTIDTEKSYVATIATANGEISVRLFADQAPQTVNNFVFLAQEGFYDGLTFHYVDPGFQAQTGSVSSGNPAYDLPAEGAATYEKGTLGMATASIFFIALGDSETDAQQYTEFTPFGQITSGLEIAEQLTQGTEIQSIDISEG